MQVNPFERRLKEGVVLGDGAMGTVLLSLGNLRPEVDFESLNLTNQSLVSSVHRAYLDAGATLIESNTFGANRFRLAERGLAGNELRSRVRELNLRGVKIAREAREISGVDALVAGSIGPISLLSGLSAPELRQAFTEQAEALLEGGADVLICETFPRLEELLLAIEAVKKVCDLPIIAQVTLDDENLTLDGKTPSEVARVLSASGASVIGVNCGIGPQGAFDAIVEMSHETTLPLSAMPNAGLPRRVDGRLMYGTAPGYFADYSRRLIEAGARIIGGCCGTTPSHIAAMARVIKSGQTEVTHGNRAETSEKLRSDERGRRRGESDVLSAIVVSSQASAAKSSAGPIYPTQLAETLAKGQFAVSVELDPPRGIQLGKLMAGARLLKDSGVSFFNVADSPMARVRMSCLATARLVGEETGVETIIHFTTRDRNLMALQSELIGAHAMGIRNVLALTGDPPRLGDQPNATGVWDVDSIGLISILKELNEGRDRAGTSIGRAARFFVGAAVNPTAEDIDKELERFKRKLDAGADFIMSQPLYDLETLARFFDRVGQLPVPMLLGIMPVQSFKHAEFLHNEVPGIIIPESLLETMRKAGENGLKAGLESSCVFLEQAKRYVQGCYLMPSFGRYELVAELIKALGPELAQIEEA